MSADPQPLPPDRAVLMIRIQILLVASLTAVGLAAQPKPPGSDPAGAVAELRLAGRLEEARDLAEQALARSDLPAIEEIALRLELARIHDRVGLHTNTRPVRAALEEVERAERLSADLDVGTRGKVVAAKAYYYYRAEMAEREFEVAERLVLDAIAMLAEGEDTRGRSDAVHLQGLIHLQRREYGPARDLFDESLRLDRQSGERAWMLGEYHRHVALIQIFQDDWKSALPHLEQSLDYRKKAGAIDASLFAALTLGRALEFRQEV